MDDRKVTVKIDPLGRPTVEAHGFEGNSCETATQGIEQALMSGNANASREIKDEWHNPTTSEQHQEQGW